MYFLFEYFFYLIFIFFKLYSLLDKFYLFTDQGSKIDKYILNSNLTNIANNFDTVIKLNKSKSLFKQKKTPKRYKHYILTLLVSITILAMKIALTYKFLNSTFFYIKIFNKTFDIATIFSDNYHIFKLSYYILFAIFIFYITFKLINFVVNFEKKEYENTLKNIVEIGKNTKTQNNVGIELNGLFQNILITGSIGSGKTSSIISTLCDELISRNICGLILDVKGNFINIVNNIARKYGKAEDVIEISLKSNFSYNPLDKPDMSSIELAHMLRQVLTLVSDNNVSDTFWLDKAESYLRNFISITRNYKTIVTFEELHRLVTDSEYLKSKIVEIKIKLVNKAYLDEELFEISSAINNIENEYLKLDDRTAGIIKAEITRITDIFVADYEINKKFGSKSDSIDFLSNKIYVLSINIAENKKLAKLISTYLKLDFQKQILSQSLIQRSVFFICDEYQEFSNSEDSHFFSLSREFKCINIVSMQSYTSLIDSLKNENTAKVIIQNLVNKIWLRNDDVYTVQEIIKQIGKEEKGKTTLSIGEGSQESVYNVILKRFKSKKSNLSKSYSIANVTEYTYNEEYFTQQLKTFEATCMISDGISVKLIKKIKLKRWEGDFE